MKNDKSKNIIIGLLLVIIIILVALVVLFATGTISLNSNKINDNELNENTNNEVDQNVIESNEEDNNISNNEKYSSIINEYKNAINDKSLKDNFEVISSKYSNVNERMVIFYHSYQVNAVFKYVYYDIDGNGTDELVISEENNNDYSIIDVFGYNGTMPVKLIDEYSLGDRSSLQILNNGIFYLKGSSGATSGSLEFSKIASDGYTNEVIQLYYYQYDENNNVSFYKELDQYGFGLESSKFNYRTIKEVEDVHLKNASIVDLNKLNWDNI